jgi:hypothetical protein
MFLLGLCLTTRKGYDYLISKAKSSASGRLPIFTLLFLELLAVVWFYGYSQFLADVEDIVDSQVFGGRVAFKHYARWLTLSWVYISQVLIFLIIVWLVIKLYQELQNVLDAMFLLVLLPIPATALYDVLTRPKGVTVWERLQTLTMASERWGPALLKDRYKWINTLYHGTLHRSRSGSNSTDQAQTEVVRKLSSQGSNRVIDLSRAKRDSMVDMPRFIRRNKRCLSQTSFTKVWSPVRKT